MRVTVDAPAEDPRITHEDFLAMSEDVLARETKGKLREIIRAFKVPGRSTINDKREMARKILEGPVEETPVERTEAEEFVRSSMMKPRKKTNATAAGTANETNILKALVEFTAGSKVVEILEEPKECGFAAREDKRHLGTSVDGICPSATLCIGGEAAGQGAGLELKTMATPQTVRAAQVAMIESIDRCTFGDDKFIRIVRSVSYPCWYCADGTVSSEFGEAQTKTSIVFSRRSVGTANSIGRGARASLCGATKIKRNRAQ